MLFYFTILRQWQRHHNSMCQLMYASSSSVVLNQSKVLYYAFSNSPWNIDL